MVSNEISHLLFTEVYIGLQGNIKALVGARQGALRTRTFSRLRLLTLAYGRSGVLLRDVGLIFFVLRY